MNDILHIQLINELEEAKKWWDFFCPHLSIYDEWEMRYSFYKYPSYEIFFYVGFLGEKAIGLLPLQFNHDKGCLEFFGGSYMEDNRVYIESGYEQYISSFYLHLSKPAELSYIAGLDPFTTKLSIQTHKFVLPLDGLVTFEDFLQKYLDSDSRGKMRRKIKKIEPTIQVTKNNFHDIELLFEYNTERFGKNSAFCFPFNMERYRDLLHLSYPVDLFSFSSNGKVVGVSLGLWYGQTYVYVNQGSDLNGPKELRNFVNYFNLNHAIENKAHMFDTSVGDGGWKEHWKFIKIPQYSFNKN